MRPFLVLLVACGSAAPPPPIVIHDPPPRAITPAAMSCGDAGVILRGIVEKPKTAGPAKEAAIASACLTDHWSPDVLDCIGSQLEASECLTKLDPAQHASLNTKLKAWADAHDGETVDSVEPDVPEVSCAIGIGTVAAYTPALSYQGEERTFAVALRQRAIQAVCESSWTDEVKLCFIGTSSTDACRRRLDAAQQQEVTDRLAEIDNLLGKIIVLKTKAAATSDCRAVVAAHYSDAAWKGQVELPKDPKATRAEIAVAAQDRKTMIAASRKAMLDACTNESWSATVRACEIAGGNELCARAQGTPPRWSFPAVGVITRTGSSACDAYVRVIDALLMCDKLPQSTKDGLRQSLEAQRQSWQQMANDPTTRGPMTAACNSAEQALRQAAPALGCTI